MWTVCGLFFLCLVSCGADQNVIVPPTITTQPEPLTVYQSSSTSDITLYCKASGKPAPSLSWKQIKGTVVQDASLLNSPDVVDGNLVFSNLKADIAAKYQCFAENSGGKTFSSYAEIKEAVIPAIAGVTVRTEIVNAGDSLELPCVIPEGTFPPPEMYWALAKKSNDGSQTVSTADSRISITETGSLLFAYVIPFDDQGGYDPDGSIYVCRIRNAETNTIRETTKIQLIVNGDDDTPKPPALKHNTRSPVVAIVGKTARMMCFISGRPIPDITWEHDDKAVVENERVSITKYSQVIDITDVQESDEGSWRCSAKYNSAVYATMQLDVQSVPTFSRQPVNTNVSVGSNPVSYCDALGEPEPNLQLYINGEQVTESTTKYSVSVVTQGLPRGTIQFQEVEKPDSIVVVQCMATNDHGDKIAAGYLNVLEPLTLIKEPEPNYLIVLPGTPNTNITIPCMARIDPSDQIKVEWFRNDFSVDYANPGFVLLDNGQTLHIDVAKDKDTEEILEERYSGNYTCILEAVYNSHIPGFKQERTTEVIFSVDPVNDCGQPVEIDNGDVEAVGTTFGSKASYSCDAGYSLIGNAEIECSDSGSWPAGPSCQSVPPTGAGAWWIALIVAGVVLLVIILVICLIQRNREVAYKGSPGHKSPHKCSPAEYQ